MCWNAWSVKFMTSLYSDILVGYNVEDRKQGADPEKLQIMAGIGYE